MEKEQALVTNSQSLRSLPLSHSLRCALCTMALKFSEAEGELLQKGSEVVLLFFALYQKLPFSMVLGIDHENLVYVRQVLSILRYTLNPLENL